MAFARPASYHRGGVNAVFADGHTQFLNQRLDEEILIRFMTVDDTQLRLPGSEELFPAEFRREEFATDSEMELPHATENVNTR